MKRGFALAGIFAALLASVALAGPQRITGGTALVGGLYSTGTIQTTGVIKAGSAPTTLTDSAGKLLSASLNTVGVAQGGTGATSLTAHGVLVGEGTSAVTPLSVGATGTVLAGATGADPAFSATPTVTSINGTHLHAADSVQTIAGSGAIALTSGKGVIPVAGSGGAVTGVTIPSGTAGQELYIIGTDNTNTVQLTVNGSTNVAATNGITTRTLGNYDCEHLVWYNAKWVELSFQNNL